MVQQLDLDAPHLIEPDLDMGRLLPVDPPTPMAQAVRDKLRVKILEGRWRDETQLPSERELSDTYKVSRPTIREALRKLQDEGLIEIQRGRAGGALVRFPTEHTEEQMRKELNQYLPELVELLDGRLALEPFFARRAASKRSPEHLKTLEESIQRLEYAAQMLQSTERLIADENLLPQVSQSIKKERERARLDYRHADNMLHHTVSVAARNHRLFEMFTNLRTEFFTFPGIDLVIEHGPAEHGKTRFAQVIDQHKRIIEAIEKQDKDTAEDEMKKHVKSTKKALSWFVDDKVEKHLVDKEGPRNAAAKAVRKALRETKVFTLPRDGSANAKSTTKDNGLFYYISDGPNGEEQLMLPVFTRENLAGVFTRENLLAQSGLEPKELKGEELLPKLDPDARVIINPGTSLEFQM